MNKYRAKKTICNQGHKHDSKAEAIRCDELHLMQKQGMISDLHVQKKFVILEAQKYENMPNERPIVYRADFVYTYQGLTVIEDTKGRKTKDYIIKRKFVKKLFCQDGKTIFIETK